MKACLMVDRKAAQRVAQSVSHLVGLKGDSLADCLESTLEWNLAEPMALWMVVQKGRKLVEHSVHLKVEQKAILMVDLKVDLMVASWGPQLAAS